MKQPPRGQKHSHLHRQSAARRPLQHLHICKPREEGCGPACSTQRCHFLAAWNYTWLLIQLKPVSGPLQEECAPTRIVQAGSVLHSTQAFAQWFARFLRQGKLACCNAQADTASIAWTGSRSNDGVVLVQPKTPLHPRAARYNTWLLVKLTPKGVVFSFLFLYLHSMDMCRRQAIRCNKASLQQAVRRMAHMRGGRSITEKSFALMSSPACSLLFISAVWPQRQAQVKGLKPCTYNGRKLVTFLSCVFAMYTPSEH